VRRRMLPLPTTLVGTETASAGTASAVLRVKAVAATAAERAATEPGMVVAVQAIVVKVMNA